MKCVLFCKLTNPGLDPVVCDVMIPEEQCTLMCHTPATQSLSDLQQETAGDGEKLL